jgi:hypothetical protein
MRGKHEPTLRDRVAMVQGAYYLATGVWPIVHMRSFEAITGPKKERWLVRTVGGMIASVGGFFLWKGLARRADGFDTCLATSSAAWLTGVDCWYSLRGRISLIYLADAVLEIGLITSWIRSNR